MEKLSAGYRRFFNIDPLTDKFYYNSPYAFSENKVTNHIELEGLEALPAQQALNREVKKVETMVMPVVNAVNEAIGDVVEWLGDIVNFTDKLPRDNSPRPELNDLNITIVDEKSGPDVNNTPKPGPNSENFVVAKKRLLMVSCRPQRPHPCLPRVILAKQ